MELRKSSKWLERRATKCDTGLAESIPLCAITACDGGLLQIHRYGNSRADLLPGQNPDSLCNIEEQNYYMYKQ